jgi:MFS family permease
MVQFSFFRSRSFLGATTVAFIVSFAMLAMFFFLALYMQNILGYSPLETGVRFLPSTLVIMVAGPLAGRLADRVGPRTPLVIGLSLVTISLAWQSRIQVDTSFGFLVVPFILLGLGMGFTMSPMSTAAMNAVDRTKAGVASGILSMSRMVGGTFGVAALGALVSAVGRHDLDANLPGLSDGARDRLAENLGVVPSGSLPSQVAHASQEAFVHALQIGLKVGAAVAFTGAIVALTLVQGRPIRAMTPLPVEA